MILGDNVQENREYIRGIVLGLVDAIQGLSDIERSFVMIVANSSLLVARDVSGVDLYNYPRRYSEYVSVVLGSMITTSFVLSDALESRSLTNRRFVQCLFLGQQMASLTLCCQFIKRYNTTRSLWVLCWKSRDKAIDAVRLIREQEALENQFMIPYSAQHGAWSGPELVELASRVPA